MLRKKDPTRTPCEPPAAELPPLPSRFAGFSLIELLIAMAILGLTTMVAVTVFSPEPHRESAARLHLE
ncbi:MAG: prepilin-type N-terminal cleavage/methylation domain-containing protein [Candidatus Riflebacteria bacterium]|nr:prepilin-type N-terminal cleavage/methylation domain-containing protein [Candidatus Riflebacteria bacterium]